MRTYRSISVVVWVSGLLPTFAVAAEIQREFRSARYLGMGDAGVSLAKGTDAIFYNPAGIADVKGILNEVVIVSPMVTASSDAKKIYDSVKDNSDPLNIVENVNNQPQHVSVQNFSGVAFRRVALGLLESGSVNALVKTNSRGLPEASVDGLARAGMFMSFAKGFAGESLLLGATIKVQQKMEGKIHLGIIQVEELVKNKGMNSLLKDSVARGSGVGGDLGLIWKGDGKSNQVTPRLGIMVRNVGGTRYSWTIPNDGKRPTSDTQQVDVGVSLQPTTRKSKALIALDVRDIGNTTQEVVYKRIHLGADLSFEEVFGVMVGFGQGYPSYGAYLNMKMVRVEGGVYSEELGTYPGDLRSKRVFSRVSVGWLQ